MTNFKASKVAKTIHHIGKLHTFFVPLIVILNVGHEIDLENLSEIGACEIFGLDLHGHAHDAYQEKTVITNYKIIKKKCLQAIKRLDALE